MDADVRRAHLRAVLHDPRGQGGTGLGLFITYNLVTRRSRPHRCDSVPAAARASTSPFPRPHQRPRAAAEAFREVLVS